MNKNDIIKVIVRKLSSRKLWMSIASFVSMLMIFCGVSENEAAQVAAIIMAGATVVGYVIAEGLSDAHNAAPTTNTDATQPDAVDTMRNVAIGLEPGGYDDSNE